MAICLANGVKAQFFDDSTQFYIEAGKFVSEEGYIKVIRFDGQRIGYYDESLKNAKKNLKQSSTYYDDNAKTMKHRYTYCPKYSTSKNTPL